MQAMIPAVRNFCEWAALRGGETRPEFERALSVVEWDGDITLPEPTNPPVAAWHLETACGFSDEIGSPARAVADVDAVRELTRLPAPADRVKALAAPQGAALGAAHHGTTAFRAAV